MEPSIGLNKAQIHGLVLAEELFKMGEHRDIGGYDGIDLDPTSQESTFRSLVLFISRSNLGHTANEGRFTRCPSI